MSEPGRDDDQPPHDDGRDADATASAPDEQPPVPGHFQPQVVAPPQLPPLLSGPPWPTLQPLTTPPPAAPEPAAPEAAAPEAPAGQTPPLVHTPVPVPSADPPAPPPLPSPAPPPPPGPPNRDDVETAPVHQPPPRVADVLPATPSPTSSRRARGRAQQRVAAEDRRRSSGDSRLAGVEWRRWLTDAALLLLALVVVVLVLVALQQQR